MENVKKEEASAWALL